MPELQTMENSEQAGAVALNTIFGYEPKISRHIIETLGSAAAVFRLSGGELDDIFGPYSKYRDKITPEAFKEAEQQLRKLAELGFRTVPLTSADYPSTLKECEDPPAVLYVRSSSEIAELLTREPRISIVGTRDISLYGKEWCRRIVEAIAGTPARPVIVSGLALGVDVSAHEAALDFGLPTIAVLPTGITEVYPARHARIASRIAAAAGSGLLTDYPPGTAPQAITFLRRNRIIAGLSQATVLIESRIHGGGTITARLASGYGRDVFALPGRIDDDRSAGCNSLIQEKIAEPVASLDTFIADLGLGRWKRSSKAGLKEELSCKYSSCSNGAALIETAMEIKNNRGITLEQLCARLNKPYNEVAVLAGTLEDDGIIVIDLLRRCAVKVKNS